MGEESLVDWLRRRTGKGTLIGDDTAVLPRMRGRAIVTVDQQIEGIHFPAGLDAAIVARRLLAVNLSDLAASGAVPRHAFLALAAAPGFDHRRFFRAFLAAAKRQHVSLAGGDLASSTRIHASLTLVGERRPGDATLARDRARPGHRIWVGGTLGESALGRQLVARGALPSGRGVELPSSLSVKGGLRAAAVRGVWRHLEPSPQLELGQWLAALGPRRAGAVIDLSDGLAKDLHRICAASGAGARIEAAALAQATPPLFTELCRMLNEEPADLVESGGEDYVLLFSLPSNVSPPPRFGCRAIGVVTREPGVVVVDASGRRSRLPSRGWDHLER